MIDNSIYDSLGEGWYTAFDNPIALLRQESKVKIPWVLERLEKHFGPSREIQLLDVGCGAGFLTNALSSSGYKMTGLDLSKESLHVAQKYDFGGNAKYVEGDAYQLPFADASFDGVTCMDFLEHVNDPERVIAEIARVLKPNGLFFYHTFNRNFLSYFVIIKLVEWFVSNTPKNMHVLSLFVKPREVIQYCNRHGLRNIEMTGIKPKFSTIKFRSLFTGVVPKEFSFELTPSLKLSFMGFAIKNQIKE